VPAIVSLLHDQAIAGGGPEGQESGKNKADGAAALATLRLVMMSGDRIPPTLPAALRGLKDDLTLVSLGGPTETTIWNILHPIGPADDGGRSIPYGHPNANNRAYVLDEDGQDMPDWVPGEICAAGVGLARGYWGDEVRTAARFVQDPRRGERLYRTGDIGRYLPDGDIEILGRTDHQIKVNGHRIEAGEVETRLVAIDAVGQAVVVRQEGARGDRLVAHLVAARRPGPEDRGAGTSGDAGAPDETLRAALRVHLPDYMVPAAFVWHDELPLTRNGKVDRGRLTTTPAAATAAPNGGAPASELEESIAAVWAAVLNLPAVAPEDQFAAIGGDSISAARIVTDVRKRHGVTVPLHRLPEVATVRAMAAYVEAVRAGRGGGGS
jgi:acyl-coenzyme A synthetase/AMP-(fatty) acid ligase/acyl carrier protein